MTEPAYRHQLAGLLALEMGWTVDQAERAIAGLCNVITRSLREDIPVTLPGVLSITPVVQRPTATRQGVTAKRVGRRRIAQVRVSTHLAAAIATPPAD